MSCFVLDDDCVHAVLSHVSIVEKIRFERVNRQFGRAVNQLLCSQALVVSYNQLRKAQPMFGRNALVDRGRRLPTKCVHDAINPALDEVESQSIFLRILARIAADGQWRLMHDAFMRLFLTHVCYDCKAEAFTCFSFLMTIKLPEELWKKLTCVKVGVYSLDDLVRNRAKCERLAKIVLDIDAIREMKQEALQMLVELPSLTSLIVESRRPTHNTTLQDAIFEAIKDHPKLQELGIRTSLGHLLEPFLPRLKSLTIEGITGQQFALICENGKNLRKLSVASLDADYTQVRQLVQLRELCLNYTFCRKRGSLVSVREILDGCRFLRAIKFPACYFHYQEDVDDIFQFENNQLVEHLIWFANEHPRRQISCSLGFESNSQLPFNLHFDYLFTHQCNSSEQD